MQVDSNRLQEQAVGLSEQLAIGDLILHHASDAIFLLDEAGRTTFANPAAEEMFGWTLSELSGRTLHEAVHYKHPDGSHFPMEECPLGHVFSTGESLKLHEDVFFRKNGSPVDVACSNAAIIKEGAVAGGVVIVRDISDRRRVEARNDLLLRELNHRVKNTLAIIQGIARQSLKGSDIAEARVAFETRLVALAKAHDLLTDDDWEGAPLREIIERALEPFCADGTRCTLDGPEARLPARKAVALSMALHELATNATKYGSLSNQAGQVRITWSLSDQTSCSSLCLTWQERGGPTVSAPARRGFGSRMIQRALAAELDGEVALEFNEPGVICTVRCTLAD